MTTWRGRRRRPGLASALRGVGIGLMALLVLAVPAQAGPGEGRLGDPRDVGTSPDLKALTHVNDGSAIVYTAETYAPFSDQSAVFKWGIDRDDDEAFDLIVFTEWRDGKLAGGVKDAAGRQLAPAAVSRPGPTVIRVSFPAAVLGAPVYRYAVGAEADSDGDGPVDPGERDVAPNSGLIQHRLGATAAPETPVAAPVENGPPAQKAAEAAPVASLPTTGPGDPSLLPWAGAAFVLGGGLVALSAQRNGSRRGEVLGGNR